VWLAVPHRARAPRLPELALRVVRFSDTARTFDVTETEFAGVPARITRPARTVADCIRLARLAGAQPALEAFRDALSRGVVTVAQLARTEKIFPCRRLRALLALHTLE
jgi:hypothetical protein